MFNISNSENTKNNAWYLKRLSTNDLTGECREGVYQIVKKSGSGGRGCLQKVMLPCKKNSGGYDQRRTQANKGVRWYFLNSSLIIFFNSDHGQLN